MRGEGLETLKNLRHRVHEASQTAGDGQESKKKGFSIGCQEEGFNQFEAPRCDLIRNGEDGARRGAQVVLNEASGRFIA